MEIKDYLLIQTLNGLTFAAVLFLLAIGLSLIFGVMRIINIAHGSFYMLGGYVGVSLMRATGSFWLSISLATVSVGIIGLLIERIFLRKFYLQEFPVMLITMGFALILKDVVFMIWGGDPYYLNIPKYLVGHFSFGNVPFSYYRTFVILYAVVVAILLWAFMEKTNLGAKLRASVDDNEMAGGVGINVPLVCASMFFIGTALAAMGGVLGSPFFGLYTNTDFEFLPLAFTVVIVGGLGSMKGVVVGSALVGLIDTFGKALLPELSYFTLFVPMVLVLVFKPAGIFGKA